ncbi:MAG TPA: hypothetical protein VM576_07970 [Xanthomonadaceae bacterium]|nr:hypothetical protein [Xanthomonadaceae bacterium]
MQPPAGSRSSRGAPPPTPPGHPRQRGFGLLETALLVLLVGAIIAASFIVLQSSPPVRAVEDQERALQWADQALVAYAAKYAQLPCPVTTPDGSACAAPGDKGWLPVRALAAVHPEGTGPGRPLRYMVYRGAGADSDLAAAGNQFSPHKWDGSSHDFVAVNGLDLCARLANAARETAAGLRADRARTTDIDAHALNVAYGLSAAGAAPGESGRFDGLNQGAAAQMESPARAASASYDDRVRVRDFNSLAQTLGCAYADAGEPDGVALASLDMMALSVDVNDEVAEQREGNLEDTELAVSMASVALVFASLDVALAGANISNSASTLATASSQLASAIASCVVLVGCALIPPYTAAVVAGGIAVGLATAATVLAAAALVPTSTALAKTIVARDMAKASASTAPPDFSGLARQACEAADGLLEQQQEIEDDIAMIEDKKAQVQARLDAIEGGLIPGTNDPLIWSDYNKPQRSDYKTDEDYDKALADWQAGSNDRLRAWKSRLTAKLAAIRDTEDAFLRYEDAKAERKAVEEDLQDIRLAILGDGTDAQPGFARIVAECKANPPARIDEQQTCLNSENALTALLECRTDLMSSQQVADRQCLPWKEADLADAREKENAALGEYNALAAAIPGVNNPWDPPVNAYIEDKDFACIFFDGCRWLFIPGQDTNLDSDGNPRDKRETYGRIYYQRAHLEVSLRLKQQELADKQAAHAKAQAQCDTLKELAGQGASGLEIPVWSGADTILEAANCKGTSGPVQPADCGGH